MEIEIFLRKYLTMNFGTFIEIVRAVAGNEVVSKNVGKLLMLFRLRSFQVTVF